MPPAVRNSPRLPIPDAAAGLRGGYKSGGMKKGRLTPTLLNGRFLYYWFSHFWLATVQEVLQADWQEVWHSPQPPLAALAFRVAPFKVWICFIGISS